MSDLKGPKINHSADLVRDAATADAAVSLTRLNTAANGLSDSEAAHRLETFGPNEVGQEKKHDWLWRLWVAVRNPLVILLTVLAIVTFATAETASDTIGGWVMVAMVVLGVSLRFIQETKADNAAAKLKAMIKVTATVVRGGQEREISLKELVPGDIVKLSAGDMIPGDVRLLAAKDLFIIQATLTGESLPVEKTDAARCPRQYPADRAHQPLFSGHQRGKRLGHGGHRGYRRPDLFRQNGQQPRRPAGGNRFDKGVKRFTWLMIRFMMVMTPLVFVINGVTKHDWKQASSSRWPWPWASPRKCCR